MPKTRKLTATTPRGTFIRRTHRNYSHVVVVIENCLNPETRELEGGWKLGYLESNRDYYREIVEGRKEIPSTHYADGQARTLDFYRSVLEETELKIAAYPNKLAGLRAADLATDPNDSPWVVAGWVGRLDLAGKKAQLELKRHRYVEIYPVDQEVK